MNTNHLVGSSFGSQGWKDGGVWFGVDLGAMFFIDEIFLYAFRPDEGLLGFSLNGMGPGHVILFSDGQSSLQTNLPVPEAFDYTELLTHDNPNADRLLYVRYLFEPRRARYLFWHGVRDTGWGIVKWAEMMMFSPGHPAEVTLRSGFIDLGQEVGDGRPKVIKSLNWEGDLPAGTQLRLRSRSGNTLGEEYIFHDRTGAVVTEAKWSSAPTVLRGEVDTTVVIGADWGGWSNFYQFSGEPFKSESPRRFIQLEMILSTDSPRQAPSVESLSIEFEDALVEAAVGQVLPRRAVPNQETRFTYTLWPRSDESGQGFDLMRFALPGPLANSGVDVQVRVGGEAVASQVLSVTGDSLLVGLAEQVQNDSVQVGFSARVLQNAAVFSLDLGTRDRARVVAVGRAGPAPCQCGLVARFSRGGALSRRSAPKKSGDHP